MNGFQEMGRTVSTRLSEDIIKKLKEQAKDEGIKPSKLMARILRDHALNTEKEKVETEKQPKQERQTATSFNDLFFDAFIQPQIDAFLEYGESTPTIRALLSNPDEWETQQNKKGE